MYRERLEEACPCRESKGMGMMALESWEGSQEGVVGVLWFLSRFHWVVGVVDRGNRTRRGGTSQREEGSKGSRDVLGVLDPGPGPRSLLPQSQK